MCITGKILKLIASVVSNLEKSMCAVPSICTRSLWVNLGQIMILGYDQLFSKPLKVVKKEKKCKSIWLGFLEIHESIL